MKKRGATAAEDWANGWVEEGAISDLRHEGSSWVVTANGWTCSISDERMGDNVPKVGDVFTTFGQFGYQFHGQALNGVVLWYQSIEDEEAARIKRLAQLQRERREQFEADRPRLDAEYLALPETFRERIDKFRHANPEFRWEFEGYEMMCCTDAVKIARYCSINRLANPDDGHEPTADENVKVFAGLPWDEQKKAGVSDGHSGNSFSFAVHLAHLWVTEPGTVVFEHGALVNLVGCETYGCPHPEAEAVA